MRHLLKTSVLLVIGLLAAQPVLSSLNCAAGLAPACVPGCLMAMVSMAPDCAMTGMSATGMTAAEDCLQSCCAQNTFAAILPQAAPDKSKVTILVPVAAFAGTLATTGLEKPTAQSLDPHPDSPPRYIVNRVFRI
jgi:hypothetical protein